ncbi:hypothetical protein [Mumia sp. Pv 4-285]|uniref:hypothetical protein n=1 Tax=Mumia qirimensis TaxID=3234852 RepID=UPI00351D519D
MEATDAAIRGALRTRLAGIATAVLVSAGAAAVAAAVSMVNPYGGAHTLARASDVVSSQPHVEAVVVDPEELPESIDVWGDVVAQLPDGSYARVWRLDAGFLSIFFGGPDAGERLEVAVDPDEPTWAASVDDAQASLLDRARYVLFELGPLAVLPILLLRILLGLGAPIPLRAYRTLRRPRDRAEAEVVTLMRSRKGSDQRVTLRIRVGDSEYSWDATLPNDCVPYVGGTLDLRGEIRDGGWVMAVDPQHGTAYPRARLRKWGSEPPVTTWHPSPGSNALTS